MISGVLQSLRPETHPNTVCERKSFNCSCARLISDVATLAYLHRLCIWCNTSHIFKSFISDFISYNCKFILQCCLFNLQLWVYIFQFLRKKVRIVGQKLAITLFYLVAETGFHRKLTHIFMQQTCTCKCEPVVWQEANTNIKIKTIKTLRYIIYVIKYNNL